MLVFVLLLLFYLICLRPSSSFKRCFCLQLRQVNDRQQFQDPTLSQLARKLSSCQLSEVKEIYLLFVVLPSNSEGNVWRLNSVAAVIFRSV